MQGQSQVANVPLQLLMMHLILMETLLQE